MPAACSSWGVKASTEILQALAADCLRRDDDFLEHRPMFISARHRATAVEAT
jgi:hypothetical protein